MFYPGEVGYTLVAPALAGSYGGFIASMSVSEPAGLVIFGICLYIVAIGIRHRESFRGKAARAKVIPLETAKIERRLATPASIRISLASSLSPKPLSSARDEFSVKRRRRRWMMDCEVLFSRRFRPFQWVA
jgi:hypothetical protein